jgi:twitching motility protein PilT
MNYETELADLIMSLVKEGGSDLHLTVGSFPTLRVNRDLIPLTRKRELTAEDTVGFLRVMIGEKALTNFVVTQEVDFSYEHAKEYRLARECVISARCSIDCASPYSKGKSMSELNLPDQIVQIARERKDFSLLLVRLDKESPQRLLP